MLCPHGAHVGFWMASPCPSSPSSPSWGPWVLASWVDNTDLHSSDRGVVISLTLSQCTLAGPVYTGMPLECHWLTQCTLGYHWATQQILAGYTGTPLEKLSWNSPTLECQWKKLSWICPTLECHWRNSNFCSLHWNTTGGTVTAHTRPYTYS